MKNQIKVFLELIRIKHWIKNILIYAPLIFSLNLFHNRSLVKTIIIFFAFSFVSVLVYILNDLHDAKFDAVHPIKSQRPIPAGKISIPISLIIGIFFFIVGIALSLFEIQSTLILLTYFLLNILYTYRLKQIAILDVFIIAIGFCLRILIGAIVIHVELSQWIILITFSISLLLGFGKRRHEIISLKEEAVGHREILGTYSKTILDMMICISVSITAISYVLYTMDQSKINHAETNYFFYTYLPVIYGLFRYLHIVYSQSKGGKPEEDLLTDRGIICSVLLWGIMIIGLLYFPCFIDFYYYIIRLIS